jgi:hypothetical protein
MSDHPIPSHHHHHHHLHRRDNYIYAKPRAYKKVKFTVCYALNIRTFIRVS